MSTHPPPVFHTVATDRKPPMYSSSPQTCHYYNNSNNSSSNNSSKHEASGYQSFGRRTPDNTSHSTAPHNATSDLPPSSNPSWNPHLEHDYSLESPTPSTSLSFQLPQQPHYSGIMTPLTSTPYVLSHASSHHHPQDSLVTPTTPTTPSLPSYGYGLSHRGFFPRPKLTTTLWEDERTVCFQVDANGICVARREDNDMINGTKLLNVAGMSRGKRDGILKNEKGRVVVKVGAMHLKGVWITFDRAKTLSAQFKIQDILYPLFVDNPQTFLYSHPMTSPISRLGSFRPFYPPSWDRTLPSSSATTPTSPSTPVSLNHHHHHHHHSPPYGVGSSPPPSSSPSDSPYDMAAIKTATSSATMGYRPGGPLFTPHTSSYRCSVNNDANTDHHDSAMLSMDGRSGEADGLAHQVHVSSPPPTSHGPSSSSSSSSYYNDLLDPNHRSNDMSFYNSNATETSSKGSEKLGPASTSHPHHSSLLDDHNSLLDGKRPTGGALQPSAFQSLDTTAFHHPQPVYMDSNTGRDDYPSVPLYLDNPVKGMADSSAPLMNYSDHSSSSSRREVMNPRNGMIQRHHPYANTPKLSNDPNFSTLKKPSTSRFGGSRFLAKEIDDLSVKTDADHRPW